MMGKALADIVIDDGTTRVQQVLDVIGNPLVALLIAVLVAMFTLGGGAGHGPQRALQDRRVASLPPIAGILLIVAAGGGFKQVLVDTGIGTLLADWAERRQHLGAAAGLGGRRADPPGDRLGDRRDDHRVAR